MRGGVPLVLRGLWFRRGVSATVLVVAALVVGAAATGPLFLRAASESSLRDTLGAGTFSGRGVTDRVQGPLSRGLLDQAEADSAAKLDARPTMRRLLGARTGSLSAGVTAGLPGASPEAVGLVYREGFCTHVRVVAGRCSEQAGTVMVSAATADLMGWRAGRALLVEGREVQVEGNYVPLDPEGDYWAAQPYFVSYGPNASLSSDSTLDTVFAPLATFGALPPIPKSSASVDRELDLRAIRLTDVAPLQAELASYVGPGPSGDDGISAVVPVLEQAQRVIDDLTLPVVVVVLQLLVLCWLVLFVVVANAAEARGPEVALAKLRGLAAGRAVAFGLADTVLLVALAVPVGLGLAWAWTSALVAVRLAPDTPMVLTGETALATVAAGAGAVAAAVLASFRTLRRPVVEQWRRATRRTRGRPWPVDVVVVLVAVGALGALLRARPVGTPSPSPIALLTPGLAVLAVALVASRLLPWCCRAAYGPTRRPGRVAALLAVRQLGRRPSVLRLALLLTVATGLVTFSVDAWAVARANTHDRAWTEVGAADVLDVAVPGGQDLGAIVDRVDPGGTQAVAVGTVTDFSPPPSILLLAVQPARFGRVAFWRPDLGAPTLSDLMPRIDVPAAPQVLLDGDRLRVDVAADLSSTDPPSLVVDLVKTSSVTSPTPVVLGVLRPGSRTLEAQVPCDTATCRVAGVHLQRPDGKFVPVSGTVTIRRLQGHRTSGWATVEAGLASAGGWRATAPGATGAEPGPGGLVLTARAERFQQPTWEVADHPDPLPALITGFALASRGTSITGPAGPSLSVTPVSVGPALPGGGDRGVVVDRTHARLAGRGAAPLTEETVWTAPGAAARLTGPLEQAGVTVVSSTSADERAATYARQGPALALLLDVASAALAGLLAGGSAILTLHLLGRRRTYELAALAALGLRRRTLLASLWIEQGVLVVFGLVVGTAAGLGAAKLALPVIPEFGDDPTAPPLRFDLQPWPVAVALAVMAGALGLAVLASSARLVREARFEQLREAPA